MKYYEARLRVQAVWKGSDANATKALYADLEALGPLGFVAANLFRASRNSSRAKSYRKRAYRGEAYGRKQWAMDNLASALVEHAESLAIVWGWGKDERQEFHDDVLYVDVPEGQVSYHSAGRGAGPDYPGEWDGIRGVSEMRVREFVIRVLAGDPPPFQLARELEFARDRMRALVEQSTAAMQQTELFAA